MPLGQDFSNKSLYFSVTFNMKSHLWNTLLQYFAKENMTNKDQIINTTCPFDNLNMPNRFTLSHQIKANIFFSNCPANVCRRAEVKHSMRPFYTTWVFHGWYNMSNCCSRIFLLTLTLCMQRYYGRKKYLIGLRFCGLQQSVDMKRGEGPWLIDPNINCILSGTFRNSTHSTQL